jgi:hypothetical protein
MELKKSIIQCDTNCDGCGNEIAKGAEVWTDEGDYVFCLDCGDGKEAQAQSLFD